MAEYQIEVTGNAKEDLSVYTTFECQTILSAIRVQLMHQPMVETRKRKKLHDNPIASWELRAGKYRIFYEVDEASQKVTIIAASYKEHNTLFIRGRRGADMKTVDLAQQKLEIEELINLARQEPVLLLTSGGEEFYVAEADDFEKEVEALRNSQAFQQFLDERSKDKRTIPLEELEKELEEELAVQEKPAFF
jgi:mRNA-degrading endonuclease RelE of RelBE toxin-antitoxin system/PHD/YefM family antitoxin component YafN of YafNO toxin-antitoxin module